MSKKPYQPVEGELHELVKANQQALAREETMVFLFTVDHTGYVHVTSNADKAFLLSKLRKYLERLQTQAGH